MLLHVSTSTNCSIKCLRENPVQPLSKKGHIRITAGHSHSVAAAIVSSAAAATLLLSAGAVEAPPTDETLSNIPQTLSSVCTPEEKDCKKRYKIQKPKSRKAEACTSKCVGTCVQGGFGSPGEGPFNIRRYHSHSSLFFLISIAPNCNILDEGLYEFL